MTGWWARQPISWRPPFGPIWWRFGHIHPGGRRVMLEEAGQAGGRDGDRDSGDQDLIRWDWLGWIASGIEPGRGTSMTVWQVMGSQPHSPVKAKLGFSPLVCCLREMNFPLGFQGSPTVLQSTLGQRPQIWHALSDANHRPNYYFIHSWIQSFMLDDTLCTVCRTSALVSLWCTKSAAKAHSIVGWMFVIPVVAEPNSCNISKLMKQNSNPLGTSTPRHHWWSRSNLWQCLAPTIVLHNHRQPTESSELSLSAHFGEEASGVPLSSFSTTP